MEHTYEIRIPDEQGWRVDKLRTILVRGVMSKEYHFKGSYVLCAFDERERVTNVVRVSLPVDSFLFFLPPRGSPGTSVCLSKLGRRLRLWVKEEKEEGGRRKATAAGWMEEAKEGGREGGREKRMT